MHKLLVRQCERAVQYFGQLFGVVSIWLVEVPVAYYLSYHTSLGIEGIWIGYPAAFIVSLILQYAYYKLSWQKKRITRLVS